MFNKFKETVNKVLGPDLKEKEPTPHYEGELAKFILENEEIIIQHLLSGTKVLKFSSRETIIVDIEIKHSILLFKKKVKNHPRAIYVTILENRLCVKYVVLEPHRFEGEIVAAQKIFLPKKRGTNYMLVEWGSNNYEQESSVQAIIEHFGIQPWQFQNALERLLPPNQRPDLLDKLQTSLKK
jgi:hypothetical protein